MSNLSRARIERAFHDVLKCAEAYFQYTAVTVRIWHEMWAQPGHEMRRPAESTCREFDGSALLLRETQATAQHSLEPLTWYLHATSERVVKLGGVCAPSFAEAIVRMAASELELGLSGDYFMDCKPEETRCIDFLEWFDIKESAVRLEIDKAQLERRIVAENLASIDGPDGDWMFEGGRVVLSGSLAELRGQSRKLLQYFVQRSGRDVTLNDLAIDVWGFDGTQPGTIQQGMSKLRKDLNRLDRTDLAEAIKAENGSYHFVEQRSQ